MQPDEVARIAARTVPGSGPATLDRLSCGLVNTSYRVVREGRPYVLRIASASALELGLDRAKTNVNGGAVAIGHPLGASGARITTHLVYELARRKGRYAVGSACIGGGQGIAVVIERV